MNNTKKLPTPSDEQLEIISFLKKFNVIVNSVAGSGKTTTNIFISQKFIDKKILLLTYNKKLREDTLVKIKKYNIKNLDTYTYHSFCVRYYKKTCYRDSAINSLLMENLAPYQQYNYDIIIVDEAQDMTPLYYKLFCKLYFDNKNKSPKICILGDIHQNIYEYNRANAKFIEIADKIFNLNDFEWKTVKLSQSFRVTYQIASFINKCLLGYDRIIANKNGEDVDYIICDTFGNKPFDIIMKYINEYDYKYDDFFVLAPSLKSESKTPISYLQQKLTENNVPIFIPNDDNSDISSVSKLLLNKIVFSTFHQVKGLERKIVIVFCFDDSYFKYYDKTHDVDKCPNTIYVACTRSSEKLIVLQNKNNKPFKFINVNNLSKYSTCKLKLIHESNKSKHILTNKYIDGKKKISVTKLISHLPFDIIDKTKKYIDIEICNESGKSLDITNISKQNFNNDSICLYESVADINGIAIPAYYEYIKTGKITICPDIPKDNLTINDVLKMTTIYSSIKNNFTHKLVQIKNYDWITNKVLDKCIKRMETLNIDDNAEFEKHMSFNFNDLLIIGSIDCYNDDIIYEFKCVNELEHVHILQLAVYMYIIYANDIIREENAEIYEKLNKLEKKLQKSRNIEYYDVLNDDDSREKIQLKINKLQHNTKIISNTIPKNRHFYLYNILNDNMLYIKSDFKKLTKLMNLLVTYKTNKIDEECNNKDTFSKKMLEIKKSYEEQNNKKNIMILDIETTLDGEIVQMAWFICDLNYNIISKSNYYNKIGDDHYGKIDKKIQNLYGLDIKDILNIFVETIKDVKYIIGHNVINFDMQKISIELHKNNIDCVFPIVRDTMAHVKNYCNIKDKLNNVKYPKLSELYDFLTNKKTDENNSHTADYDIIVTLECIKKLKKLDYDVIDNYREYDSKVIKKPRTMIDKLIYCVKNFIVDKTINNIVYDSENKKYISLKKYLIYTYSGEHKIAKKSIVSFFENNEMNINNLKKFCKKYKIWMIEYDTDKNVSYEYKTDNKSKYKIMKYVYHINKIFPIDNNYMTN